MAAELDAIRALAAAHADGPSGPLNAVGTRLYREPAPTPPVPVVFGPTLYLVLGGRKQLLLDDRTVDYGAEDLVVSCVDLAAMVQVTQADEDEPYLALEMPVERDVLADLAVRIPPPPATEGEPVSVHPLPGGLLDPVLRLLRLLDEPEAAAVLAAGLRREILYRVLAGPGGAALLELARTDTALARIGHVTRWMHENVDAPADVTALAARAGMSVATFHRRFKGATGTSPVDYHKRVRLHEARRLIAAEDDTVSRIASAVGYASPSHFSRDYKRIFGVAPALDAVRTR